MIKNLAAILAFVALSAGIEAGLYYTGHPTVVWTVDLITGWIR